MSVTNAYFIPTIHSQGETSLILRLRRTKKKGEEKVSAIGGRLKKGESFDECIERKFKKAKIKKLSFDKIMKDSKKQIQKVTTDSTTSLFVPLKNKKSKKILGTTSKRKGEKIQFIAIKAQAIHDQVRLPVTEMRINGRTIRSSVAKALRSAISQNIIAGKVPSPVIEKEKEVDLFKDLPVISDLMAPPIPQPDLKYAEGDEPSAPPL